MCSMKEKRSYKFLDELLLIFLSITKYTKTIQSSKPYLSQSQFFPDQYFIISFTAATSNETDCHRRAPFRNPLETPAANTLSPAHLRINSR